ncbi:putative ankyrin repeat protein RF_0381 [Saccostrea cucullata]|uniref:putative ankyrin repeat protein RF_0381 n=1 Tax=Saccostrea cuccullata TaxID=36930 RepID=UPI002ED1F1ED
MSLSKYKSTQETTNTARLARLILGPCTDVLREILKKEIPPSELSKEVKQWTDDLKKNKKWKHLNQSQVDIIFPKPTYQYRGDYSDLDISILYIILRNVSKIPPHSKGWGENPDPADRSVAANIERIRLLRNKYYGHSADISLSNSEFSQEWQNILDFVVEMERHIGTSTMYQESVKEAKTCSMDPEIEHRYISRLGVVDVLQSSMSKLSEKLSDIEKKLNLRIDPELEKSIEATMVMVNDHHKETEKVLVKTRAFDRAKKLLEKNRHVVIKGVPGAGKTTLANCLLKIFMDRGKRPFQVFEMSKLYGRVSPFDNLAIFIDNAFGKSSFSINEFNDFINMKNIIESLVKSYDSGMGNILILTVRNDIYMEIAAKQKSDGLLFTSVTDLSIGEYALESEEFIMFLNNYNLPENITKNVKLRQVDLYLPLGFPQCCRLARENPDFGNDLSNFLSSPSDFLKEYLKTLISERAVKTAVLIYILLKGENVDSSLFSDQKDRKMKLIALNMLELSPHRLSEFHESVKVFEEKGLNITAQTLDGENILHIASKHEKGLDINALSNDGKSVLHIACLKGMYDACEYLLTKYPQLLDVKDKKGYTVLHYACANGDRKLISFLIEKGLDIDALTNNGESVLHIACLCENGLDINTLTNNGESVLHIACLCGKGLDINALTNNGESGLHIACLYGMYDACDFLVTNFPQLIDVKDNNGETVLHKACENGDRKLISFLAGKGLDINALTNNRESVLHIACLYGKGFDINALTNNGESVLHIACHDGNYDACEFLITNYPQLIDVRDDNGYTVLHSSCENGNRKLISFLIEKGMDINALTNNGKSLLHIACHDGKGLDFNALTNNGESVFHIASHDENGFDINAQTKIGKSVLHIACFYGNYDACKGLDINALTNNGKSVLHIACFYCNYDAWKGLDINALTNNGESVLHIASHDEMETEN